jgi:D-arabinose 1-dehydrogenase-like Zn-dependent alcohol dehydrogenase
VSTDTAHFARKELTIRGVRSGRREDLEWVLEAAATGSIRVPPVISWPLERIDEAFLALQAGTVSGQAVIDLSSGRKLR